jgi:hypothetical protein
MIAYRWIEEKGNYETWTVRAWVFTHLLNSKKTGTNLDDKPVEYP